HLLRDCPEKDRADQKRAQGFTPARPQFGGASNFAQNYQTQFSQKPHLQNGHPRTPPSSLQFNGFPQHSGGHPSYSSPPMQNRAMGGFIEYEDLEEEEPHRTSNYQMPSKEGCTADLPLQLPYASTNYQAPSVEECTKKQTLQTPADQELYVPQTLTPGRPHYQTYDASAANGGPEVRARMIPS
ncbi:hypothetical protein PtrCC142_012063, partial [Pyrenophora tritici-repentis]